MAKPVRLLSVGAFTLDTILRIETLPTHQGKFIASDGVQIASGMATSAACAAHRLGAEVSLWASAGDDPVGDQLIADIEGEGVDCSLIRRVTGARSALAAILVDAHGERIIVPFYDRQAQADPDALPLADLSAFDAVLVDVRWPGAAALALSAARSIGRPAILDADTAPVEVLERLLPLASHIVASEPAARIVCGHALDPESACADLASRTDAFVAVTGGAGGTWWHDRATGRVRHVEAPKVKAIDTLAAGDVFHGAFAVGLAEAMPMEEALRFASAAAALKCLRFGGRLGAPTRAETLAMMAAHWPPAQKGKGS
ncbi:sugar kinase [Mesorhizobium sp. M2D.F.Ca.ET.185.01.1.1]|uniref:sugar kinase n=1 Tax=unclassified Mesorhizobium TaxID=325217 RepID=UPI000FCC9CBB|nr:MULTISPECIES: sugar kinase [unclassified Mesorhizobium]TGP83267.1 sugar kinase [bacterium M00.F.Ca.ET.227.01.1.1]TGP99222.1 sugar kinase [bacterium M00.F.Ca.ET.221.01.1.1]TGP99952.1 sugar kinase [bacterium M00.F.Ca.ET.222.01.1.1]TGU11339.1 sugar kinase [bacterium M00.F.Ca.ET.163.01.1.1]TGU34935.1 sugar kinase [bacterium M00.F.Ca.ET.156.01.1.1]TGU51283.1 sugar kinase [bacterium M00.F.Ca.ET.146.01.1.1]TGV71351.1 sugar kinase [Mesorhizobium sp. M2D.F.Ca.ET.160.01.1.1]TGW13937.1 sugar kinase